MLDLDVAGRAASDRVRASLKDRLPLVDGARINGNTGHSQDSK
jgi:hypothetical protein